MPSPLFIMIPAMHAPYAGVSALGIDSAPASQPPTNELWQNIWCPWSMWTKTPRRAESDKPEQARYAVR